ETHRATPPHYAHDPDGRLPHAAGLTTADQHAGGDWAVSSTIITREARDAAGDGHDRMPAFLDEELMSEWLAPGKLEKDERENLHGMLGDLSEKIAGSLVTHPVDRAVNNVRTLDRKDPSLIAPLVLG